MKTYWTAVGLPKKSLEQTINNILKHYDVTLFELQRKCRERRFNEPRSIIAYILRTEFNWTLKRIGNYFERDHATALHHYNRVKGFMEVDKEYNRLIKSFT